MRIEHIAIWVSDLERSKKFYCQYFGGKASELYHNQTTDFMSYFIRFEEGARLEIMKRPDVSSLKEHTHLGLAHFTFSVGSKDDVIALTEQLRLDGFKVKSEPRTTGDGYFESVVLDFEGNEIEITL
ncbi:VOC family protein [Fusibacter ferrireducens]|uniref:VOC family protein n=1 Tax=Fusibacter ferrireducens TaxID=2785058 RepID=A0ABR9ZTR8_9FIRM|nr:VOC family protein [Fusibacter ferrireducens]MBF4693881.1 VOC family protein [Fusibacter ferrireducens]